MTYTVLLTGAASGIGHCFAKHYLNQPDTIVIAVDKDPIHIPIDATTNSASQHHYDNLLSFRVDFSSTASIHSFIQEIRPQLLHHHLNDADNTPGINLLIHAAGIRGLVPSISACQPHDVAAAETLSVMDAPTMLQTYTTNTLGTFTLLQSLLTTSPRLLRPAAKAIILSSRMGSLSANTTGGAYAYRASKAALNAIVRSLSIDVPDVLFLLVHPGRVETRLTPCREEGAAEVEEAVGDMLAWIGELKIGDSGGFVDRFGGVIRW